MTRNRLNGRTRVSVDVSSDGRTIQSAARECDINFIMDKYRQTGLINHVNKFNGDYLDLTNVPDYHTSMNKVLACQEAFNMLPAEMRRKFNDNPSNFLNFVSDDANLAEMVEMGLIPDQSIQNQNGPSGGVVSGSPDTTPADSAEGVHSSEPVDAD